MIRIRLVYLNAAVAAVLAGLASRRYRERLPAFLAEYAGDTLWALMLLLLVSAVLTGRPLIMRAAISIGLSFWVEISQLYHAASGRSGRARFPQLISGYPRTYDCRPERGNRLTQAGFSKLDVKIHRYQDV